MSRVVVTVSEGAHPDHIALVPGGPCYCAPARTIRFVLPDVPGLAPLVSCRANGETGRQSIREHAPPRHVGSYFARWVPSLSRSGE